jgi:hypothetical protein
MSELSLRFTSQNDTGPIFVSLFRPDTGVSTNPVEFTPPLDDKAMDDLRWYLEAFSVWPSGPDYERRLAYRTCHGGLGTRASR